MNINEQIFKADSTRHVLGSVLIFFKTKQTLLFSPGTAGTVGTATNTKGCGVPSRKKQVGTGGYKLEVCRG